ncbi:aldehyde dehydrogenase family protein [Nonomuraea insulae]|uniref:Aldehyde dehydrogenase family protein n=1 Tax=Nonomuraea insulae TaxID=1616787 RepID=A0ABW1D6S9_9ACTN
MTIAGRPAVCESWIPVENPATAAVFGRAPLSSAADVKAAVAAASAAARMWSRSSVTDRSILLRACGEILHDHTEELAQLLTCEQGKPLREARDEVSLAADWFGHTADLSSHLEPTGEQAGITLERIPHGVVAAIAPSNYPIILAVVKLAPALLAGNTVVVKPSPLTPLSTLRMAELLTQRLPPGVINTVCGGAELGMALVTHPGVDMVSFTGSVSAGRTIAAAAGRGLRRVVLELGGNDACVVLPGADVTRIAPAVFAAATRNCGQFCAAIKRVYVSRAQATDLAAALAEACAAVTLGDGLDPATDLGPLVSKPQRERVTTLVAMAESAGGKAVSNCRPPDLSGHFFPPTVVSDLPPGTALETDEQFGPAIPVIAYDEVQEAVDLANASGYGLGGSVWGDSDTARPVAAALRCGTVWVNTHGELRHDVPFGGLRDSGVGVEYGYWGLLEYTRIKVLNTSHR